MQQPSTTSYVDVEFWRVIEASYSPAELKKICPPARPVDSPRDTGDWRSTLAGFVAFWLAGVALILAVGRIWGS